MTSSSSAPRRRWRLFRPLDRYVTTEFLRIFLVTSLGFPFLVFVVDLVDNLRKYTERNVPAADIALSYWYYLPDTMYKVLPAAVLFATVFSIGNFTRHAEITAAKASGMSFYRFVLPIFLLSFGAAGLGLVIGELSPPATLVRQQLLRASCGTVVDPTSPSPVCTEQSNTRYNFVFGSPTGRVIRATFLNVQEGTLQQMETAQRGDSIRPAVLIQAERAEWRPQTGWMMQRGFMHVLPDDTRDIVIGFDSLIDGRFEETPTELRASDKESDEMTFAQLSRFISRLETSGSDVTGLRVERMLKIAIPMTCVLIAMLGAPLATSTQRGGAAFGVGISLAVTVIVLILIQLTKAFGKSGLVAPELAAWSPNILVGSVALVLLARVRT